MTFKLFLLCSFVLLARPQDVLTFLQPMRPALVLTVLAMAALVFGGHRRELAAALSTAEAKRYVFFFALMILGIPFAYHRGLAFEGVLLGYTVNVFFFVLLVSQVTSLQRLKSFLWVICLSTMVYSVFGGLLQAGSFDGGRFGVLGGVFDANDTAYVLLSLFPLCLYFVQFDAGLVKRLVAIAAICGAVATILLTGSRGGIVAFGAVLLMLLLTRTLGGGIGRKMLLVLVLASSWFLMKDKIDVERYLTLSDLSSDYNLTSQGGRIELWKEALDLSLAHPVTGVGVHCFAFANDQCPTARGRVVSPMAGCPQFLPAGRHRSRADRLCRIHAHSPAKPSYLSPTQPVAAAVPRITGDRCLERVNAARVYGAHDLRILSVAGLLDLLDAVLRPRRVAGATSVPAVGCY